MNHFSLSDALVEWLRHIDRADATTSVAELGRAGYALVGGGAVDGAAAGWVVQRDDVDPVQLRVLNRIVSRAVDQSDGGYATVEALRRDVLALASQTGIPPSRRALFERLVAMVHTARGGTGSSTIVQGDSGIGKTYLWRAVEATERRHGDVWVYDKSPQSGSSPYLTYGALLTQLLRNRSAAENRPAAAILAEVLSAPGPHQGGVGVLRWILSQEFIETEPPADIASQHQVDVPVALAALLRRLADRSAPGAVVLAIDDLQWVDDQSAAVLQLVAVNPERMRIVFLGRPEAVAKLPPGATIEQLTVGPLTPQESDQLLSSLLIPGQHEREQRRLAAWVDARAPGNPMTIVDTARTARQLTDLGRGTRPKRRQAADPVDHKIDALSRGTQTLLEYLALLLPPVATTLAAQLPADNQRSVPELLQEAEQAEIIQRDRTADTVFFCHDSIEEAVRRRAAAVEQRVAVTVNLLRTEVHNGDNRAAFVLARMLTGGGGADVTQQRIAAQLRRLVSPTEMIRILRSAADSALTLLVPREALVLYEEAERLSAADPAAANMRLELHLLAHRAAFMADDGHAMSRHFRFIHVHGTIEDVSRARTLWVSRAYAKTWIRGAARIGWRVLADLGAVERESFEDRENRQQQIEQARAFFARRRPQRLAKRVLRAERPADSRADLIAVTCVGLLTSTMTIDPERLWVLAWIMFKATLHRGPTRYTGFEFLCWSMAVSADGGSVQRRQTLSSWGREVSAQFKQHGEDVATYSTRAAIAVCGSHWRIAVDHSTSELSALYEHGMQQGHYEWATICGNIHFQNIFFCGVQLESVVSQMEKHRRRLDDLGLVRLSSSVKKYQQAAECLAGSSLDPTMLTSSISSEQELFDNLKHSEDHLGLVGFYIAKMMLCLYAGRPRSAYELLDRSFIDSPYASSLYGQTVLWFHYGLIVAKVGSDEELSRAVEMTHLFGPYASGPHRMLVLDAEWARRRGRVRRAERLYRRARLAAIADGFPNEGALIAEYHADFLLESDPRSIEAIAALHEAHSLYERWGAAPAARRVSDRLSRLRVRADRHAGLPEPTPPRSGGRDRALSVESRAVQSSLQELERTRHYTQLLFDATQDALLLVTDAFQVLFHNAVATPFLLVHPDGLVELREEVVRELEPFIGSALATSTTREAELEWRNRVLMVSVTPVAEPATPTAAVGFRDVTALKARERELVIADRMSSLGMLSSIVAHEVGNANHILGLNGQTLRAILSNAKFSTTAEHAAKIDRTITSLLDASGRIGAILTQIREYAAGGRADIWERSAPAEIGRRVVGFTHLLVRQHTDGIVFDAADTLPAIRAIPGRLEQALINLIKNACEALPDRSAEIALRISCNGDDRVSFAVCDQGRGMPARAMLDVDGVANDPFSSTRVSEGGTGLGLSIVRTIVEQHRGILRFGRTDRYATVVEILVPVAATPEDHSGPNSSR